MPELKFKKGDKAYVACLDEYSIDTMSKRVGTWGTVVVSCPGTPTVDVTVEFSDKTKLIFKQTSLLGEGDAIPEKSQARRNQDKQRVFAHAYGASPTGPAAPQQMTTVSATIVLPSGREVRTPDPNGCWKLKETKTYRAGTRVHIEGDYLHMSYPRETPLFRERAIHNEFTCWAADMARIVNETVIKDHFTTLYSCITELRIFETLPSQGKGSYDCALPTLKVLW